MSKKRQITSFFTPVSKKPRPTALAASTEPPDAHVSYPFPIARLPTDLVFSSRPPPTETSSSSSSPSSSPSSPSSSPSKNDTEIPPAPVTGHGPTLSISYFRPLLHATLATQLYTHLLTSLPFYRVTYTIPRAGQPTTVHTPRYTTLFGLDATSPRSTLHRPIPSCLQRLMDYTIARAAAGGGGGRFNYALVNYYHSGGDSIAWHSDCEPFLEAQPTIASLSLGASREFWMRPTSKKGEEENNNNKKKVEFVVRNGECLLMSGDTQRCWEHCVPKRKGMGGGGGGGGGGGRINVTFRYVVKREGTGNYYKYNVGSGPVYRWDEERGEMRVWMKKGGGGKSEEGKKEEEEAMKKEDTEEKPEKKGIHMKEENIKESLNRNLEE